MSVVGVAWSTFEVFLGKDINVESGMRCNCSHVVNLYVLSRALEM